MVPSRNPFTEIPAVIILRKLTSLLVLGLFLVPFGLSAQTDRAQPKSLQLPNEISESNKEIRIDSIRMRGLTVWSRDDIQGVLDEVGLRANRSYSPEELRRKADEALRNLQEEGLFSDVQVNRSDNNLIFSFEEYARISTIKFSGNEAFEKSKLLDVLLIQEGDPANPFNLKQAREQLRSFYEQKGYSDMTVRTTKRVSKKSDATISFEIQEGKARKVNQVEFKYVPEKGPVGEALRNWYLRMAVPIKPGDPFSRQIKKVAVARIKKWYSNQGYLDSSVDVKLWKNLEDGGIDMRFVINEGQKYTLGDVTMKGNKLYSDTELMELIPLEEGDVFSSKKYQEGLRKIRRQYTDRGYANVSVNTLSTEKSKNREGMPSVQFQVNVDEGQPVYVQRIEIHGNHRTYEKVIRREIRLEPGGLLDGEKKRNSLRRLRNLGYFEQVKLNVDPGKEENWKIVRVRIREGRTGQFQFGGGFSSSSGFLGNLSIRKDNFSLWDWSRGFTGRGQSIQASAQVGQRQSNFNISWDDPWINDDLDEPNKPSPKHPLGFGWSAFNITNNRDEGFDEIRQGGALRLSREFGPARSNKFQTEYSFEESSITGLSDVDTDDVSLEFLNEADGRDGFSQTIGSLSTTLSRDRRDNRLFPTDGYYLKGSTKVASSLLASDLNFYQPTFESRFYIPFWKSTFWAFKARYESIATWQDDPDTEIPSTEKFFLGGNQNVRGYEFRDILVYKDLDGDGLKDEEFGGGQTSFHMNLEYRIQLMEDTMQLFLFGDIGNVYADPWELSLSETKKSAGIGFRVRSPMGPINISWAQRLEETFEGADDVGETQIDFNIGTGF